MPTASSDTARLNELHESIWAMIIAGQRNPACDMHWPMLASVSEATDGRTPEANVRTVVLRAADRHEHWLECHSAISTPKIAELHLRPAAMMAFYDRNKRQQIRAKGKVSIYNQTSYAASVWSDLNPRQQQEYAGFADFGVLRLHINSLDWLHLSPPRHQRARFDYTGPIQRANLIDP